MVSQEHNIEEIQRNIDTYTQLQVGITEDCSVTATTTTVIMWVLIAHSSIMIAQYFGWIG